MTIVFVVHLDKPRIMPSSAILQCVFIVFAQHCFPYFREKIFIKTSPSLTTVSHFSMFFHKEKNAYCGHIMYTWTLDGEYCDAQTKEEACHEITRAEMIYPRCDPGEGNRKCFQCQMKVSS
jgi:hypothetical protein